MSARLPTAAAGPPNPSSRATVISAFFTVLSPLFEHQTDVSGINGCPLNSGLNGRTDAPQCQTLSVLKRAGCVSILKSRTAPVESPMPKYATQAIRTIALVGHGAA